MLNCVGAEHPLLLKHLRERILSPPSSLPYNWTSSEPRYEFISCIHVFQNNTQWSVLFKINVRPWPTVQFFVKHLWEWILSSSEPRYDFILCIHVFLYHATKKIHTTHTVVRFFFKCPALTHCAMLCEASARKDPFPTI